jgi:hypothetical protein
MAWGAPTAVLDRHQTKIVRIPFDAADVPPGNPAALVVVFAAIGMGDCYRVPLFAKITRLTGPNSESEFQITAMARTGFTIQKVTNGGAGAATLIVKLH